MNSESGGGVTAEKRTTVTPSASFAPMDADAFLSLASMEGLFPDIVEAAPDVKPPAKEWATLLPGVVTAALVGTAAYLIHHLPLAPFSVVSATGVRHPISAAIIAIVVGVLVRNVFPVPVSIVPGCKRLVRKVIPVAIVFTGAGLNLSAVATIGPSALFIIVTCLVLAVGAGYYIGRLLNLSPKTALLIGAGTGICGNSAIVAVAPLVDADDEDLVLSIGTINLMGLATMLLCPLIGGWIGLTSTEFGLWSGTSIHAVPQVVAAGFAFDAEAGTLATLVKLVRVTLLAPLVLVLAVLHAKRGEDAASRSGPLVVHYARLVPWFVWGFVGLSLLSTLQFIPTISLPGHGWDWPLANVMTLTAKLLLTLAMAAIGLELNVRQLARVGMRALSTGALATVVLASASLGLILLML